MTEVHSSVPSEVKDNGKYDSPEWIAGQLRHLLQPGKAGALSCKQIASLLNIRTDRTYLNIRTAAKQLLAEGRPVITCAKGIFIAKDRTELEEYVQTMQVRIQGFKRTIELVNAVSERHYGTPIQKGLF